MKPEKLYHELKDVAEKLGIKVFEQNFKPTGIAVQSGFCKVKGEPRIIIDKHKNLRQKIDILADCLSDKPYEGIFLIPAVRELLDERQSDPSKVDSETDSEKEADR